MTEAEWSNGTNPIAALLFLRERVSQRKVILFNCACCRNVWNFLCDEDQIAVTEFEANSDDPLAITQLEERYRPPPIQHHVVHTSVGITSYPLFEESPTSQSKTNLSTRLAVHQGWGVGGLAHAASKLAAGSSVAGGFLFGADIDQAFRKLRESASKEDAERHEQSCLIRDIFGNPFRPVSFDPEWRSSTAVLLAKQMYESRDFSTMPILADALQDAGCDNADILAHCRDPQQTHVRGCWVVDLVLGKE